MQATAEYATTQQASAQYSALQLNRLQLGRLKLSRLQLGRLQLNRLQLGRLQLSRLQLGRLQLNRLQLGRLQLSRLTRLQLRLPVMESAMEPAMDQWQFILNIMIGSWADGTVDLGQVSLLSARRRNCPRRSHAKVCCNPSPPSLPTVAFKNK